MLNKQDIAFPLFVLWCVFLSSLIISLGQSILCKQFVPQTALGRLRQMNGIAYLIMLICTRTSHSNSSNSNGSGSKSSNISNRSSNGSATAATTGSSSSSRSSITKNSFIVYSLDSACLVNVLFIKEIKLRTRIHTHTRIHTRTHTQTRTHTHTQDEHL